MINSWSRGSHEALGLQILFEASSHTMATANPLIAPSPLRDVINPQFYQNNFPAEVYIKTELGIKLDKGKSYSPAPNTESSSFPP
jgi:hypothetical protein